MTKIVVGNICIEKSCDCAISITNTDNNKVCYLTRTTLENIVKHNNSKDTFKANNKILMFLLKLEV